MIGSLTHQDYHKLVMSNHITSANFNIDQIQPSSIDLSLSEECYEIKYSFLPNKVKVKDKLEDLIIKKINLKKKYIFEINKTYLVKLNEELNLSNNLFGHCNPKSTTGRLDIFCRTLVDYADEYEQISNNYKGSIYLEITSRSFNIEFQKGDRLNQLRLINKKHNYISDKDLVKINKNYPLITNKLDSFSKIDNGLKVSVDLSKNIKINAFSAKKNTRVLHFNKINFYKIKDFWKPIKNKDNSLIIEKNKFYILKSKEKVRIPPYLAGEMIPYDTGIGDFRAHYAGFFDPGFGDPNGSYAVLEVKTNEIPFLIEDNQTIARIKYEKLNKKSNVVYGDQIKSNYQNQGLKLSKHFIN
tara:strand:- start:1108 stop:2175 length:1068 start_codon:yes stop_codon:yes gene_type:complete